jgi:hypothetical protein
MSLIFKSEPSEVAEVVNSGLQRMALMQAFRTPRLARIVAQQPRALALTPPILSQPMPVYHLGLKDLAEGRDLDAAVQTGWRYMLNHENEVVASADTVLDADEKPVFAQVTEGPLVNGTATAIQMADTLEGEYEVRLLMVPALYTAALWLVDTTEGHDLAIPISPAPSYLTPEKPIPVRELLAMLQKAAKELVSHQGNV